MWLIINKRPWLDTNPIVNVGLQAALGLAEAGEQVEFVAAGRTDDWQGDLRRFYGLEPHPNLNVRVIPRFRLGGGSASSPLYYHPFWRLRPWRRREPVTVFSRDSAMLPYMVFLKKLYDRTRATRRSYTVDKSGGSTRGRLPCPDDWRKFRAVRCAFACFFHWLGQPGHEDPLFGQLLKNPTRPRTLGLGAQAR